MSAKNRALKRAAGHTRWRASATIERACLLTLVLLVAGCGGTSASPETTWVPVDFARSNQPLFAAIENEFGFGYEAIIAAGDRMAAHEAHECLAGRGYDAAVDDLIEPLSSTALSPVESARQVISAAKEAPSSFDSIPIEALDACIPMTPPAVAELLGLLEPAIASVSDRVRARPEYLDAVNKSAQCRAERTPQDLSSTDERAIAIAQEYQNGAVDQTTALAQLDEVERRAREHEAELTRLCGPSPVELERALVIEEQEAFLEREPDFVPGLGEEYGATIAQLADFMRSP